MKIVSLFIATALMLPALALADKDLMLEIRNCEKQANRILAPKLAKCVRPYKAALYAGKSQDELYDAYQTASQCRDGLKAAQAQLSQLCIRQN